MSSGSTLLIWFCSVWQEADDLLPAHSVTGNTSMEDCVSEHGTCVVLYLHHLTLHDRTRQLLERVAKVSSWISFCFYMCRQVLAGLLENWH